MEFDAGKDAENRARHGLPLAFGARILDDAAHVLVPTIRAEDLENRFKLIGLVDGQLYTAIFTWRGDRHRYISVRRSNRGEERTYRHSG